MSDTEHLSRSRRINGKWDLRAAARGVEVCGAIRDLSTSGFYFTADERLTVGRQVAAEISTGPGEPIRAVVEIVREEELGGGRFGYGVRFDAMTEEDVTRLGNTLTAMRRRELADDFAPQISFTRRAA